MTSQEKLELSTSPRTTGKHWSRKLRRDRQIPAVVYGPKIKNQVFSISEVDAQRYSAVKFENSIFVLKSEDRELNGIQVLKKVVDLHPATHRPIHMDFYALDMTQTVRVHVEVRFEGKSQGERDGGVFNVVRREVEIECLPTEIPEFFEINISELKLDESLHISDLKIPAGTKLITSTDLTLATVAEVREEAAAAPVEAVAAEGAVAPTEGAAKADAGGDAKGKAKSDDKKE